MIAAHYVCLQVSKMLGGNNDLTGTAANVLDVGTTQTHKQSGSLSDDGATPEGSLGRRQRRQLHSAHGGAPEPGSARHLDTDAHIKSGKSTGSEPCCSQQPHICDAARSSPHATAPSQEDACSSCMFSSLSKTYSLCSVSSSLCAFVACAPMFNAAMLRLEVWR